MLIAFAKNGYSDVHLTPMELTLEQLFDRLGKPRVGEKNGSYYIRGGDLVEPKRSDENLKSAELLIIDGDSSIDPETGEITAGAPPIHDIHAALTKLGISHFVHTSHSYKADGVVPFWKYRVVIPCKMQSQQQLEAGVSYIIAKLHEQGVWINDVVENRRWSQPWFLPRVATDDEMNRFVALKFEGETFQIDTAVTWHKEQRRRIAQEQKAAERPVSRIGQGDSVIERFNKANGLEWIRGQLQAMGYRFAYYDRSHDAYRYIAPSSETRTAGVVVMKGKFGDWITYSHHGGHDPLSGRVTDAFSLYAMDQHGGDLKAAVRQLGAEERKATVSPLGLAGEEQQAMDGPLFLREEAFASGWKPAEYLIEGLIQRGWCYAITSPTGHGKTSVALNMVACVGTGQSFGGMETLKGKVGYFAAENPNDVQARWIGMREFMRFDRADVWFCPLTVNLSETYDQIAKEAEQAGGFDLIIVDTSQAFFDGSDDNSNVEMVAHAKSMRRLTRLPGNPCVIILCHPTKNATKENLTPKGGGGFLNEIDGNLTIWNDGEVLTFHHQGKYRGADFAPFNFALKTVTPKLLRDGKGRQIPTVLAEYISEDNFLTILKQNVDDQDKVMLVLAQTDGRVSYSAIAAHLEWVSPVGLPNKGKISRIMKKLKNDKLVKATRAGGHKLTAAGKAAIKHKAKAARIILKSDDDDFDDADGEF